MGPGGGPWEGVGDDSGSGPSAAGLPWSQTPPALLSGPPASLSTPSRTPPGTGPQAAGEGLAPLTGRPPCSPPQCWGLDRLPRTEGGVGEGVILLGG